MASLDKAIRGVRILNRFVSGIGAVFLIPLMLLTAAEVLSRNLFNHPIAGAIELSEYLLAVFIILGIAYTQQMKGFVGVHFFVSRLDLRVQLIFRTVTTLLSLFLFSILAWQGWVVGIRERTVSDMLRIPQYPFRLLVAVAAFLMCLELLIDLGEAVTKLVRRP